MMKRISCIFGRHWYIPSKIELYLVEKKPHSNVYRSIARCMYCGKENEQLIEIPHWGRREERRMDDSINRQAAVDALWKALYEYEDKTEKQFMESEELDVGDWIQHREFVQNMSDIDRQTILNLPSAEPQIVRCRECKHYQFADNRAFGMPVKMCEWFGFEDVDDDDFCSRAERRTDE